MVDSEIASNPMDSAASPLTGADSAPSRWTGARPRELQVTPFWLRAQTLPAHVPRTLGAWLVVLLWASWLGVNLAISRHSVFATVRDGDEYVPLLGCGTNREFWRGPDAACGVDAALCAHPPGGRLKFRCPAHCSSEGHTYQHWPVGNTSLMRETVVVGSGVYRGDSFICPAAIHAGIVSPVTGGCGELEWLGPHANFSSSVGAGGWPSTAFDADFPLNFRFVDTDLAAGCHDLRGVQIGINVLYIYLAAYLVTHPALFLGTLGTFGFWTVALAGNVPFRTGTPPRNHEFVSREFARFLPFCLGLVYVYHFAAKPQLKNMPASLSRALFYGTGFVLGVLENYVFGAIPIDRIIVSDLNAQPGAWLALGIVIAVILAAAAGQAYGFWLAGKLRVYASGYGLVIFGLVVLASIPGQTLRLHHYILGLVLLPGTSLRTTPSLFFQGLLTGLYTSGVARWDFDSILQTADQLGRGDALAGATDPTDLGAAGPLALKWTAHPTENFNLVSVIVNDVERARVPADVGELALDPWASPLMYVRIAAASQTETGRFSDPIVFTH